MDVEQFCNSNCKITNIKICHQHESIKLKGSCQKALTLSSQSDSTDSEASTSPIKRGYKK